MSGTLAEKYSKATRAMQVLRARESLSRVIFVAGLFLTVTVIVFSIVIGGVNEWIMEAILLVGFGLTIITHKIMLDRVSLKKTAAELIAIYPELSRQVDLWQVLYVAEDLVAKTRDEMFKFLKENLRQNGLTECNPLHSMGVEIEEDDLRQFPRTAWILSAIRSLTRYHDLCPEVSYSKHEETTFVHINVLGEYLHFA